MNLNQVTLPVTDFAASVAFYQQLGLQPIVSARGEYARFELPDGGATLSLHLSEQVPQTGPAIYFELDDPDQLDRRYQALLDQGIQFDTPPTDQSWLWREAWLRDPSGNRLCLYFAGENRRNPPWRLDSDG